MIDGQGVVYVADQENARIEEFDLQSKYFGEIAGLGRVYSLALGLSHVLWAGSPPLDQPEGSAGWLLKLDRRTVKTLGRQAVGEGGLHAVAVSAAGAPMIVGTRMVQFKQS